MGRIGTQATRLDVKFLTSLRKTVAPYDRCTALVSAAGAVGSERLGSSASHGDVCVASQALHDRQERRILKTGYIVDGAESNLPGFVVDNAQHGAPCRGVANRGKCVRRHGAKPPHGVG